ncbi:MAG: D-tyrosyl-tRNA(Tyr) deacylase [Candidatus Gastranaerophilales bacterium]|nr:D-tyrosyl-tRNA(Tyr) deacylase [Candidatus Gastranaerophilales bacterium]
MKLVIQRVKNASVTIDNELFSSIEQGYLILFGVEKGDTKTQADWLANKVSILRCFSDENGKMNLSIKDVKGEILIVSQFTLCGDIKKGTRPSFDKAMAPNEANEMYEYFISKVREQNIPVKTGVFGAHMDVQLLNDGPVTFVVDAPLFT